MVESSEKAIRQAREWIAEAQRIAVLTGAGISAESGIPTFRGLGSQWRGHSSASLATPEAFARDPKLVWEWYDWRRGLVSAASPNAGHLALAALERRAQQFTLITQNVDGLHARAGSRNIAYLHGDIWTLRCTACGQSRRDETPHLDPLPPQCDCGGMLRPGVVWFGEPLPPDAWQLAETAARTADVFLVVGTSAVVMPAGGLVSIAREHGARVIEINAEETRISRSVDLSLRGLSGELLPQLIGPEPPARLQ
jgi:NAD-dependent deacetylase